jgi:hypothetical protein
LEHSAETKNGWYLQESTQKGITWGL